MNVNLFVQAYREAANKTQDDLYDAIAAAAEVNKKVKT